MNINKKIINTAMVVCMLAIGVAAHASEIDDLLQKDITINGVFVKGGKMYSDSEIYDILSKSDYHNAPSTGTPVFLEDCDVKITKREMNVILRLQNSEVSWVDFLNENCSSMTSFKKTKLENNLWNKYCEGESPYMVSEWRYGLCHAISPEFSRN